MKLNLFGLPYRRVVYIDASAIVIRPIDQLFALARRGWVAAAPDNGLGLNPERFNAGFMVAAPDNETLAIMKRLVEGRCLDSYDGADQGFLLSYFTTPTNRWISLDQKWNTLWRRAKYPDYDWEHIHVLKFVGQEKPWEYSSSPNASTYPGGESMAEGHPHPFTVWHNFHQRFIDSCPLSLAPGSGSQEQL